MRGSFKNKKAKIASINIKTSKVTIEGIQRSKKDGAKMFVPFDPSVLQIMTLNLEDKQRSLVLERKSPKATPNKSNTK